MSFLIQSIALFSLFVLASAGKANVQEVVHKECAAQSKIDDSYLEKANNEHDFIDDDKFNNYLLCSSKKNGVLVESFEVSEEIAKKLLQTRIKDEARVNALAKKCIVKGATAAETAYSIQNCLVGEAELKFAAFIETYPDLHKECAAKSHVEDATIEKATKEEVVNTPAFQQYWLCVFGKNGVIKESFDISLDIARKALATKIKDEAVLEEVLKKCVVDKKLETAAKTVFTITKCVFNNVEGFKFVYKF